MTPYTYVNFDKKNKEKNRKFLKYKIIAAMAVFFVIVAGLAYAIIYSPLAKVKNVSVAQINVTAKQIDTNKLANDLETFLTSRSKITKFLGSDNIFIWTDKGLAEFPKSPEIEEINMKKDYVERTIKVDIKLRQRFGVWCFSLFANNASTTEANIASQSMKNEGCYWFDRSGVLFGVAPELEGNAINKIDDFSARNLVLGDVALAAGMSGNLVKIFETLEKSGLGIRALKLENLDLQEVVFDQPQSSLPKMYFSLRVDPAFVLPAIENLQKNGLNKIDYIDFRVENRVYYKPK